MVMHQVDIAAPGPVLDLTYRRRIAPRLGKGVNKAADQLLANEQLHQRPSFLNWRAGQVVLLASRSSLSTPGKGEPGRGVLASWYGSPQSCCQLPRVAAQFKGSPSGMADRVLCVFGSGGEWLLYASRSAV